MSCIRLVGLAVLLAGCSSTSSDVDSGAGDSAPRLDGSDAAVEGTTDVRVDARPDAVIADAPAVTKRQVDWVKRFGADGFDRARAVAVDSDGNVYLTGYFAGDVDFGDGVKSSQSDDVFLASFDPSGKIRWAKHFGGTQADVGNGLAIDAANHLYMVGEFRQSVDIDGELLTSKGEEDIFVASFDASGKSRWAKRFGSEAADEGNAIAVSNAGECVVAGAIKGPATIGATSIDPNGTDALVIALDAGGEPRWAKNIGGAGLDVGRAAAVDGAGFIHVGGEFSSSVDFGGVTLKARNQADAFIARYDASGKLDRAAGFGGDGWDNVRGMAIDGSDNLFIVGTFYGSIDFGGGPHSVAGSSDFFVASFDASGIYQWSRSAGGNAAEQGRAVAVGPNGVSHVTGEFRDMIDLGGETIESASEKGDLFVLSSAPSGDHLWSAGFGGNASEYAYGIAVGADNALYVTGAFSDSADFGSQNVSTAGKSDIYLVKLVPSP